MNPVTVNNQAIADTTPIVYDMAAVDLPCTVTLKSSAPERRILLSTDGGTEFFQPPYDVCSATMLVLSINSPVSHVRVIANAGSSWRLQ